MPSPFYYRYPFYPNVPRYRPIQMPREVENCQKDGTIPAPSEKKEEESTRISKDNSSLDSPLFEILGIKLYFDDILLISILFFLYAEGVEDEMLFIALILLLLS